MTLAQDMTVDERPPDRAPASLEGRIDAMDGARMFGWVWDSANPTDRARVQVLFDKVRLVEVSAEKPRVDLKRNGIGDGAYAFDIELPAEAMAEPGRLTVKALATDGTEAVLRLPSSAERVAEAAMTVPLSRILDRLDRMIVAQERLQKAQYASGKASHDAVESLGELLSADSGLSGAVQLVRKGHEDFTSRMEELDLVLMRFDTALKSFDERLAALAERNSNEQRPHLLLLCAIVGIIAGVGIAMALGL